MMSNVVTQKHEALGTLIEVTLPASFSFLFSSCFEEFDRIENTYSRFLSNSVLSQLNANLGTWQKCDPEMLHLLNIALTLHKNTNGAFDITLKSNLDKIGYDATYSFKENPAIALCQNKLRDVVFKPILIKGSRVMLRKEIDFGGFGKGYALDQVAKIIQDAGCDTYYINAGGDILVGGTWDILLEHPDDISVAIGKISLTNASIASSAANKRRWLKFHHLINAKTLNCEKSVKAIFVTAPTAMYSDAYATALFTSGFETACTLYKSLGVEMLLISSQNKMFQSPGFEVEFYS